MTKTEIVKWLQDSNLDYKTKIIKALYSRQVDFPNGCMNLRDSEFTSWLRQKRGAYNYQINNLWGLLLYLEYKTNGENAFINLLLECYRINKEKGREDIIDMLRNLPKK